MVSESILSATRGMPVEQEEVDILLSLMSDASANVRLNALDTLTHLPLPEQSWMQVERLIQHELQVAKSLEDKATLIALQTWLPFPIDVVNEARKVEENPKRQIKLLDTVERILRQYPIQRDHDHIWESSTAPGFVLLSEAELLTRKAQLASQLSIAVSKLSDYSNWLDESSPPDLSLAEPVLVTLLFEHAIKDTNISITNELVANLAKVENFRPELHGLFEEYLNCVNNWIRERGTYDNDSNGRWFQVYRDDEDGYSWHSWQIAWTVSRGGLKGLISGLSVHLTADSDVRKIAALALIADSADYLLQRRPALFGGGVRPSRRSAPKVHVDVTVSVSHPRRFNKGHTAQVLVNIYLPKYRTVVLEKLRESFENEVSTHELDAHLPKTAPILIGFSSADFNFSEPTLKELSEGITKVDFIARPNAECRPGSQHVKFFVQEPKTKKELLSAVFLFDVTDYAFDHISRPLASKLSASLLAFGSFAMYVLTAFEQIDTTLGITAGTAILTLAGVITAIFNNLFNKTVTQSNSIP